MDSFPISIKLNSFGKELLIKEIIGKDTICVLKFEEFQLGNVRIYPLIDCMSDVIEATDSDIGYFWLDDTDLCVEIKQLNSCGDIFLVFLNGDVAVKKIITTLDNIKSDLMKIKDVIQKIGLENNSNS